MYSGGMLSQILVVSYGVHCWSILTNPQTWIYDNLVLDSPGPLSVFQSALLSREILHFYVRIIYKGSFYAVLGEILTSVWFYICLASASESRHAVGSPYPVTAHEVANCLDMPCQVWTVQVPVFLVVCGRSRMIDGLWLLLRSSLYGRFMMTFRE